MGCFVIALLEIHW